MAYLQGPAQRWIHRKTEVLEAAERAYLRVFELSDPARWAVAAAARVGLRWGDFADDFQRLPVPAEWSSPEIRAQYIQMLDSLDDGPRLRAKRACEVCLSTAAKARIAGEHTEACEAWLGRHFPAEHPALNELRPRGPASAPLVFGPARIGR
jgi:hypothetical protein